MFLSKNSLLVTIFCGLCWHVPLWAVESKADLVGSDYAEERVVDLSVVKKVSGQRKILFLKTPRYTEYLEGFIRGMIVDYNDNPVEGVLVRVGDPGEENSMFDPTVTNFNGIYRIRFSIPLTPKAGSISATRLCMRRIGSKSVTAWATPTSRWIKRRPFISCTTARENCWRFPRACAKAL